MGRKTWRNNNGRNFTSVFLIVAGPLCGPVAYDGAIGPARKTEVDFRWQNRQTGVVAAAVTGPIGSLLWQKRGARSAKGPGLGPVQSRTRCSLPTRRRTCRYCRDNLFWRCSPGQSHYQIYHLHVSLSQLTGESRLSRHLVVPRLFVDTLCTFVTGTFAL